MLLHRTLATGLLMGLALLAAPSLVQAQEIHVLPDLFDYGDVAVGAAATQIFDISNTGPGDVEVAIVVLTPDTEPVEYTGPDFAITMAPEFPVIIPMEPTFRALGQTIAEIESADFSAVPIVYPGKTRGSAGEKVRV